MPNPVIHTTVEGVADKLALFAGSRHVEVRVLDATEEEERAAIRQSVEEADDNPVSLDANDVFCDIRKMLADEYGLTK